MKRKDLQVLVLVAFVAVVFSLLLSKVIFGSPQKNRILVPEVEKISSEFPSPQTDDTYKTFFNNKALNPTQLIQIGGNNNNSPFNDQNQQ